MSSAPALYDADLVHGETAPQRRAVLEIRDATKVYEDSQRDVVAFRDVDLTLHAGEIVCLLGPSGCGKSSLLRMTAGLDTLSEGSIRIHGKPVEGPDPRVGVVFQDARLLPWLTVRENIAFAFRFDANNEAPKGLRKWFGKKTSSTARVPDKDIATRVDDMLAQTGLSKFADAYPDKISGGMAQRVALARSLVRSPEIILCDEPFAALDALLRMELQEWLVRLVREEGASLIFVTHDIEEALFLGDRIAILTPHPGKIAELDDVDLPRPRNRNDRAFFEARSRILQTFKRLQISHLSE